MHHQQTKRQKGSQLSQQSSFKSTLLILVSHFSALTDGRKTLFNLVRGEIWKQFPKIRSPHSYFPFLHMQMCMHLRLFSSCNTAMDSPPLVVTSISNLPCFTFYKSVNLPFLLNIWILSSPLTTPCVQSWNSPLVTPGCHLLSNFPYLHPSWLILDPLDSLHGPLHNVQPK